VETNEIGLRNEFVVRIAQMAENAPEKETEYKKGEGEAKESVEASNKFMNELNSIDWKSLTKTTDNLTNSNAKDSNPISKLMEPGPSKLPDFQLLDAMKNGSPKGDKGGPERQPEDNKLYAVDEKGNRIGGDNQVHIKTELPGGKDDKGGPDRLPEDNVLYPVDEKGNRVEHGGEAGPKPSVDLIGTRDVGLLPSDSFDPSRHGVRQPLETGDTFFRLRGTQFLHRENGDHFMLHPDGQWFLTAQDTVNVQSENGVTRISFRNGDEIEFDGSGIRQVTGRGRVARRK
jgi:hypothetical protein